MVGLRVRELESTHPNRQRWNLKNEKMDTTAGASEDLIGALSDEDASSLGSDLPASEAPRAEVPSRRPSELNMSLRRRRLDPLRSASGSVRQVDVETVMSFQWKVCPSGQHIDIWIAASICGNHLGRAKACLRRRSSFVFDVRLQQFSRRYETSSSNLAPAQQGLSRRPICPPRRTFFIVVSWHSFERSAVLSLGVWPNVHSKWCLYFHLPECGFSQTFS